MRKIIPLFLVLSCLAPLSALSQTSRVASVNIPNELSNLNTTLIEIRGLLALQLEAQTLELTLKRSQLAVSQAENLEAQLRVRDSELGALDKEEDHLANQLSMIEVQAREGLIKGEEVEVETYLEGLEMELERIEDRKRQLKADSIQLQSRLRSLQEVTYDWLDQVDRQLGGR